MTEKRRPVVGASGEVRSAKWVSPANGDKVGLAVYVKGQIQPIGRSAYQLRVLAAGAARHVVLPFACVSRRIAAGTKGRSFGRIPNGIQRRAVRRVSQRRGVDEARGRGNGRSTI
jgi:hypothetical protein